MTPFAQDGLQKDAATFLQKTHSLPTKFLH